MTTRSDKEEYAEKLVTETGVKFKSLSVVEGGNGKVYYPPSFPKERSGHTKHMCILVCLVLSTVDYVTNTLDTLSFIANYGFGFVTIVLYHLFYRVILLCEEYKHIKTRYDNRYVSLLKDTFAFSMTNIIILMFCILIIGIRGFSSLFSLSSNINIVLCFGPTVFLMQKICDLNASPLNSSLQIANMNGLDYGSGMAYSYYHGYLKLIMHDTGTEDKNLKELMEIYEDEHGVKFAEYKLFILIPLSLRCWVSLKNNFSPSVDDSRTIREKQLTVAGVHKRVYKNSVYKIRNGPNKVYVSAEYASPLKTYNDVVTSSGHHADQYRKYKNEISLQFFLTLKKILKYNHCDDVCELIFFEDSYVDEENKTRYHDVGKVLLTRLKDLKKTQSKKAK